MAGWPPSGSEPGAGLEELLLEPGVFFVAALQVVGQFDHRESVLVERPDQLLPAFGNLAVDAARVGGAFFEREVGSAEIVDAAFGEVDGVFELKAAFFEVGYVAHGLRVAFLGQGKGFLGCALQLPIVVIQVFGQVPEADEEDRGYDAVDQADIETEAVEVLALGGWSGGVFGRVLSGSGCSIHGLFSWTEGAGAFRRISAAVSSPG